PAAARPDALGPARLVSRRLNPGHPADHRHRAPARARLRLTTTQQTDANGGGPPAAPFRVPVTLYGMPYVGQHLNAYNGFRRKLGRLTDDVLEMEAYYSGEGGMPPGHFHPSQDEHFAVLEGAVRAVVDGEEHRYGAGETFDIPARTTHQMTGAGPARLHWE